MDKKLSILLEVLKNKKRNICYGAGVYGQRLLGFLRAHKLNLDYFVVTGNNMPEEIFGVPVKNINEIDNCEDYNWLIGVSEKYTEEIKKILESKNIRPCFITDDKNIENIIEDALLVNQEFRNVISESRRCFILGTGGTIRLQDLKNLYNEDVFSCSFCSLLEDYNYINPKYYVLPALTSDPVEIGKERETYIREKINFFSKTITSNVIFCDYYDYNYIQYYKGFKGKKIYYLYQAGEWDDERRCTYDLCAKTPAIQTGSIMMLKIAIFMGYKEIYLIGTEHDLVTHNYGHAYDLEKLKGLGFDELFKIATSQNIGIETRKNRDILRMSLNMYNQYYYLNNIAKLNGVHIYNATEGGSLDEFERTRFEELF
ncbi:MAG: hypothetical protein HFH93_09225 [Lachnospiraceae bacterium]|nr:hypothetical protein [Lachnospiraceae bacterium]